MLNVFHEVMSLVIFMSNSKTKGSVAVWFGVLSSLDRIFLSVGSCMKSIQNFLVPNTPTYSWVISTKKKVNQSHYRPEVPRGFQEVKVPRLRDNGPGWW